tara:strand:+ start:47551 stop:48645 length:1095 start_codon:yes stop_codon:yes gene_type:complete
MRLKTIYFIAIVLTLGTWTHDATSQEYFIPFNHPEISYEGRVGIFENQATEFYWSGTSVSINFEGTKVSAKMKEEFGGNYYDIFVDGTFQKTIKPAAKLASYVLASNLSNEKHSLEILKRTEYDRGKSWFYGFELGKNSKVLPKNSQKKHRIEYYGDSITAGYSVDDYSGNDSPDSIHTNYTLSYANIIAQHFDAEQQCICKSGIGITISWFPAIMPEIWDRTNPLDQESEWNFSNYTPDLVIVNLFQNDSWLINLPDHPSFKKFYGEKAPNENEVIEAYAKFVKAIRTKYPNAAIIATLGNMDITQEGSEWPGYIEEAVTSITDENIYTIFTPFKNTPGHPKVDEQKLIAENLIPFIEHIMGW